MFQRFQILWHKVNQGKEVVSNVQQENIKDQQENHIVIYVQQEHMQVMVNVLNVAKKNGQILVQQDVNYVRMVR